MPYDFIRSKLFEHLGDLMKYVMIALLNHQGSSISKTFQGRFLLKHRSQNPVTHYTSVIDVNFDMLIRLDENSYQVCDKA